MSVPPSPLTSAGAAAKILCMRNRTIHDDDLRAHFITFSCYRRRRPLDHDRAKRVLLGVLNAHSTTKTMCGRS